MSSFEEPTHRTSLSRSATFDTQASVI